MTNEATGTKDYFSLNSGLNTESNEINFPDGFTQDERNYELLVDGSRRRRKGLSTENSHTAKTITNNIHADYCRSYIWRNVGGDPDTVFIVHKLGDYLYFTQDASPMGSTYRSDEIDLDGFRVSGTSDSGVNQSVSFTQGRGYLFVSGTFMYPIRLEYDSVNDVIDVEQIEFKIRDYTDAEDGYGLSDEPTSLSDALKYNLRNRGWKQEDIDQVESDLTKYPNKSVPWYYGYKAVVDESTASSVEKDGTKEWDSARYDGEPATNSSAPKGSLILPVLDSRDAIAPGSTAIGISTWSRVDNGSTWTVTITTTAAHGLGVGVDIQIEDMSSLIDTPGPGSILWSWDGTYTTEAGTTGSTIVVTFTEPSLYTGFDQQFYSKGRIVTEGVIDNPDGKLLNVGPKAIEFHDGHLFYAGVPDQLWSDFVFFSQIPQKTDQFAKCYQEADPTDPNFNAATLSDGGWFILQGAQGVQEMLSTRSGLLIFAKNGVWEVGGARGIFTTLDYSVRKITDIGCSSPVSPILAGETVIYASDAGAYVIAPNQYTGVLEATSLTQDTIQTKWDAMTEAEASAVYTVYDNQKKDIWFLYGKDPAANGNDDDQFYTKALILSTRVGAWSYYEFNSDGTNDYGILSAVALTKVEDEKEKIKFVGANNSAFSIATLDLDSTDYLDPDGTESPLPYLVTGWDNIGDYQRRRQAPIVTVFQKSTETGYTETGNGWAADNPSSTLMTPYWDWTNDAVTNKIGTQSQVYRKVRDFVPASAGDVDGYPVVVTRNKVRGRGRVLQLRFDGEAAKDSHILGFSINYKVTRRV